MFKLIKPAACLLIPLLPVLAKAQNCNYDYLGTKTLYRAIQYKSKPAPAGYIPVFINHVGRHGARHLTKEVSTSFTYALLAIAEKADGLTANGKRLKAMVTVLDKVEHGQVKSISEEGKDELQGIGKRMAIPLPTSVWSNQRYRRHHQGNPHQAKRRCFFKRVKITIERQPATEAIYR
jgi:hypothetical protein